MRTREEIERQTVEMVKGSGELVGAAVLPSILETLLDIRDLLSAKEPQN